MVITQRALLAIILLFAPCLALSSGQASAQESGRSGKLEIYQDADFQVQYETSATNVWQRQPILVKVRVLSRDPYITLKVADVSIDGLELVPIPAQRHRIDEPKNKHTVFELGWIIVPLLENTGTLQLPPVQLERGGTLEHSFTLPALNFTARALPPYVSPLVPVGRMQIMAQVNADSLLDTDTLAFWKIQLRSLSTPANWFPPLLRQVQDSDGVEFLPAEIRRASRPDIQGFNAEVDYLIPFKAKKSGVSTLPGLRLQYFDPDSGKLVNVYLPAREVIALGWPWRIAAVLMLLLVLGIMLTRAWRYSRRCYRRWRLRRRALQTIQLAGGMADIRDGLSLFARAEGWPENLVLHAWYRHWLSRYAPSDPLHAALQAAQEACYSGRTVATIEDIRRELYPALRRRVHRHASRKKTMSGFQAILPDLYFRS